MDQLHDRPNFKIEKFITTALKSVLQLIKCCFLLTKVRNEQKMFPRTRLVARLGIRCSRVLRVKHAYVAVSISLTCWYHFQFCICPVFVIGQMFSVCFKLNKIRHCDGIVTAAPSRVWEIAKFWWWNVLKCEKFKVP